MRYVHTIFVFLVVLVQQACTFLLHSDRYRRCALDATPNRQRGEGTNKKKATESDCTPTSRRRHVLNQLLTATVIFAPLPSWGGEVGARITKAVTTSDLGISVRTSVVKGAQVMDQLDGKWEKFSDQFGLGSERSKAGGRPQAKNIPDPSPLDIKLAQRVLEVSDQAFCTASGIRGSELQAQIDKVAQLAKASFERSGVEFSKNVLQFESATQYNFAVYVHFKAYSDLIVNQKIPFGPFRSKFERVLGQELVSLIDPNFKAPLLIETFATPTGDRSRNLSRALTATDGFLSSWRAKGLVALTERDTIDDEKVSDWLDDVSDLEFSVALDGDITLNAQMLLQEQGFRLYPNFCRYAINYLMQQVAADQKVSAMDYYFDTDYNSDPDKFEVKEVLLSVQLENP